jgi:hypothetical protein
MRKRISRNAPCPCGSGKKYKQCCLRKGIEWAEQEDGTIVRATPLSSEASEVLEELRASFRASHGRDPEPADRIFDGAPSFEVVEHLTVQAMKKAGIEPALIYAFEKTGFMLNAQNEQVVPDADVAEWDAAIDGYERSTGTKATRRRLSEDDVLAILANGPRK